MSESYEKFAAIREGHRNAAEDAWFKAIPDLDARQAFCRGFDAGYKHTTPIASPAGAAVEPVAALTPEDEGNEDYRLGWNDCLAALAPQASKEGAAGQEQAGAVADAQIDALLDANADVLDIISDPRERMRRFARRVLGLAAPGAAIAAREQPTFDGAAEKAEFDAIMDRPCNPETRVTVRAMCRNAGAVGLILRGWMMRAQHASREKAPALNYTDDEMAEDTESSERVASENFRELQPDGTIIDVEPAATPATPAAPSGVRWIAVADQVPTPEVFVLCWDGKKTFVDWFGSKPDAGRGVTHWMPYPMPPGATSDMHDGIRALSHPAPVAAPAPASEAVAWQGRPSPDQRWQDVPAEYLGFRRDIQAWEIRPLYAHLAGDSVDAPVQQADALTEAQAGEIWRRPENYMQPLNFARAIEAAHGIGAQQDGKESGNEA